MFAARYRSHRAALAALAVLTCLAAPEVARGQGLLIPTDPSLKPLAIKHLRVSAAIKDGTAVTRVDQVFINDGPRQLEAHYVFPLPKGAALSEFYLWINGKKTKAEMLEKEKATAIYEGIVRRLQDPGLLEYIDSEVFRARVFPVPARGEQRIELAFSQVLDFSNGLYRYQYPLGASALSNVPHRVKQDFTFSATIGSKVPMRSIYSPTHPLQVSRKGDYSAVVGLEQGPGTDLTRDLELFYSVSQKAIGLSLLTYKEAGDPGYFLALVSPKHEVQKDEVIGKRVTLVLDSSGSMAGERMQIAKDALSYCLKRLNPQDRFNTVRFSTDVEALFEAPRAVEEATVKKALSFVESMEALGGTAIDEAMVRALQDGAGEGVGPHLVIFITDGHPTIGETSEEGIAKNANAANKGASRVFTFGVGEELNARLLDRLAADNGGTSDFVKGGKELEERVSSFYDKVSHPVLTDVELDLSGMGAFDVYPRKLPDLFKGSQVVVLGRYREAGDVKVTLAGKVNGERRKFEYGTTTFDREKKDDDFIPRLWAIRKVGYLLEEIRLNGEKKELRETVVTLGKRFGIVTPYTSYLVVEDTPTSPIATPRPPVWNPGWREEAKPSAPAAQAPFGPRRRSITGAPSAAADSDGADVFAGAPAESLGAAEGRSGVAMSKKTKQMKEEERAPEASDPVRVAGGRTYLWRSGGWIDSEALDNPGQQLKVKYLSAAYFELLKLRPDLKAGIALGDRVVLVVGKGKAVVIAPDAGEEAAEKVTAFLKR